MQQSDVVTREERVGDLLGRVYDALVMARSVEVDADTLRHLRAAAARLEADAIEDSGSPDVRH